MDTPITGPDLTRAWRAHVGLSQEELGAKLGVAQSIVSFCEKGTRLLTLPQALALQGVSKGAVPATSWGYSEEQVALVLAAAQFPALSDLGHTASDFTLAPELDDDHPPIPLDIQAGAGV